MFFRDLLAAYRKGEKATLIRIALDCIAAASIIYVALTQSILTFIVVAVPMMFLVLNMYSEIKAQPKPELTLCKDDGTEAPILVVGPRPLDVDALVKAAVLVEKDSLAQELALKPSLLGTLLGMNPQPYESGKNPDEELDDYEQQYRQWLKKADQERNGYARILRVEIIKDNPSSVDADDARISVDFPQGFVKLEEGGGSSTSRLPPTGPTSKRRAARGSSFWGGVGPFLSRGPALALPYHSPRAPSYDETSGELEVYYQLQPIRHKFRQSAGNAFSVLIPGEGKYTANWTVRAANLPEPSHGQWVIEYKPYDAPDKVTTLEELDEDLRGYGIL